VLAIGRYHTILLDADDTLFDFHRAEFHALQAVLENHQLSYTQEDISFYRQVNEALWRQLEQGILSRKQLQDTRFSPLLARLGSKLNPAAFNQEYLDALGEAAFLTPKALSVCRTLSGLTTLAIVTNGITKVQRKRLALSPLAPYITHCFVSEEIGVAKPSKEFFHFVFQKLKIQDLQGVMIVGDSLTSDIQGGINAGIATCWYCPTGGASPLPCDYQISSLRQLLSIVNPQDQPERKPNQ
jgi:2-haloacid dehalogenase